LLKSEKIGDLGQLYNEDCLVVMRSLPDNSITGICCDPPAGIAFMNKNWDSNKGHRDKWISWMTEVMTKALRVLKPGGMAFVWAIPRTAHWTAMAMEDAGFFVKDKIYHIQGQGFPKSTNISAKIDQKLGLEREVVGKREHPTLKDKSKVNRQESSQYHASNPIADEWDITTPASEQAKLFDGYGSALKPAAEEWIVAMKPNDGGFADNALKWGIAGINVDAGRIGTTDDENLARNNKIGDNGWKNSSGGKNSAALRKEQGLAPKGRYPANLILQHSPDCVRIGEKKVKGKAGGSGKGFDAVKGFGQGATSTTQGKRITQSQTSQIENAPNETIEEWDCSPSCPIRQMNESVGIKKSGLLKAGHSYSREGKPRVYQSGQGILKQDTHADEGHVSRYFKNLPPETPRFLYFPKASRAEREKGCTAKGIINGHPTIKSLALIKELASLLKMPQNTLILDMFAGSGTLGVACEQLKIPYILIEKEEEYCDIIRARVAAANEPDKPVKRKKIQKPTNTLIPWEEITNE
jgi:site-specific DNA-methyltransferase (adenine-specific)